MNPRTTEDRLKAALSARAEQVTQDSLQPALLPVPQRRPPLRLLTFALPLTVAAASAALIITATLVRPSENHTLSPASTSPIVTPTNPVTPGPSHAATAKDGSAPGGGTGGPAGIPVPQPVNIDLAAYPDLSSGDRSLPVKVMQTVLNKLHYDAGPVDGYFGRKSSFAVGRFRTVHQLPQGGRFGARDWTALLSGGSARPRLERGSSGEAVRRVQRALTAALGRTVTIDGNFGAETEQAVQAYQGRMNIETTGVVDETTWNHLGGEGPEPAPSPSPPSVTPSATGTPEPSAEPTVPAVPGAGS
jgi:peptidoglycan hydrolase-like protein with peptidoglycan-binding domain